MRAQICFFVSIVFSFVAWGAVTSSLILPERRRRGRNEALRPLLMFHSFRFVGLAFLVPGVVSPDLPAAFAEGAAYGDIVAAALVLLTLALLPGRLGIVAAWVSDRERANRCDWFAPGDAQGGALAAAQNKARSALDSLFKTPKKS